MAVMCRLIVVLCISVVSVSCGSGPSASTTSAAALDDPRILVRSFVDALIDEEYGALEGLVDERHLAFLTAIERGTSREVAGMLKTGVPDDVRRDVWASFARSLSSYTGESIGRIRVGSVTAEFAVGQSEFVAVDMFVADGKAEWILRLTDDGWVIDLLATFGTAFLPNLRGWFAFIGADDDAAFIRDEFEAEISSLRAGLERLPLGPLSASAQEAADELLADFGG